LKGIIETDETFVGGKVEGQGRGYKGNKTVVVGAFQRDGAIRLQVVSGRDRETLQGFIRENVAGDAQAIYTDEWEAYKSIADHDTKHETVNHSEKEYVRGDIHTNTESGCIVTPRLMLQLAFRAHDLSLALRSSK